MTVQLRKWDSTFCRKTAH